MSILFILSAEALSFDSKLGSMADSASMPVLGVCI